MTELKPDRTAMLMELAKAIDAVLDIAQSLNMEIEVTATKQFTGRWVVMTERRELK